MPRICLPVRVAGACVGVCAETAIFKVSTANGNWVSSVDSPLLVDSEDDDRANDTSGLFVAARSSFLPEPEPFGRMILVAPVRRVTYCLPSIPSTGPVASKVASLYDGEVPFHPSERCWTTPSMVSEPTPTTSPPFVVRASFEGTVLFGAKLGSAAAGRAAPRASPETARAATPIPAVKVRTFISLDPSLWFP